MSFIKNIEENNTIVLEKCTIDSFPVDSTIELKKINKNDDVIRIAFLDVETTGLDLETNEIIEIAIKLVEFNKSTGTLLNVIKKYESFNQPKEQINDEITKLTGITNEIVKDKSINWDKVGDILSYSQLIVAHNSKFDRPVLEKYFKTYKIWACSQKDIDWYERGFTKENLEILSIWHGFYYDSHRAVNDVNATINLLTHKSHKDKELNPILELIENAKNPHYLVINRFPYNKDYVDIIKKRSRNYFYNSEDKSWRIILTNLDEVESESLWLGENIYGGSFKGKIQYINILDKYKGEK